MTLLQPQETIDCERCHRLVLAGTLMRCPFCSEWLCGDCTDADDSPCHHCAVAPDPHA